jgi:flagellar assembly factor FliW
MSRGAAVAFARDRYVNVSSDLLGPLAVGQSDVMDFPAGLFGFPECRSFVLLPAERQGVYWLQSAEYSALTFLLVDPFLVCPGYSVDLGAADLAELQAREVSDVAILAIVTLPHERSEPPTANLQGPIAFNLRTQRARQIAISDSDYGVRYEITLPA